MHRYFIKTPWFVKLFFPSYIWNLPADENAVYLTFDDGPHPTVTPWVLEQLKLFDAQATFFCIGKNVEEHKDVYKMILDAGHATGNHTYTHMNGWKTENEKYLNDVAAGAKLVKTNLFRPPYGRIRSKQADQISSVSSIPDSKIIMWDVLSADFDTSFSPQQCLFNVISNVTSGSIIVFHDSEKAFSNLEYALPSTLNFLKEKGFKMKKIEL
ncbi:MAG: polysaccharide deacetylase family protein [Flavisolibacter sp.]